MWWVVPCKLAGWAFVFEESGARRDARDSCHSARRLAEGRECFSKQILFLLFLHREKEEAHLRRARQCARARARPLAMIKNEKETAFVF